MTLFSQLKEALLHLAYPHVCEGCGTDVLPVDAMLCLQCLSALPRTQFEQHRNNPVEKLFWGRMPLVRGSAFCYFTKRSAMQHLMHALKYRGNQDAGIYLGRLIGHSLNNAGSFADVDALVPLPLYASRERKRGYNQAALLCKGISEILNKPVFPKAVRRKKSTHTQTAMGRVERWQNMEGGFELADATVVAGRHLLLVDDVVTTGATLEACGKELLKAEGAQLSIATLCYATG